MHNPTSPANHSGTELQLLLSETLGAATLVADLAKQLFSQRQNKVTQADKMIRLTVSPSDIEALEIALADLLTKAETASREYHSHLGHPASSETSPAILWNEIG